MLDPNAPITKRRRLVLRPGMRLTRTPVIAVTPGPTTKTPVDVSAITAAADAPIEADSLLGRQALQEAIVLPGIWVLREDGLINDDGQAVTLSSQRAAEAWKGRITVPVGRGEAVEVLLPPGRFETEHSVGREIGQEIREIEKKVGLVFRRKKLLLTALLNVRLNGCPGGLGNWPLAWLGDSLLGIELRREALLQYGSAQPEPTWEVQIDRPDIAETPNEVQRDNFLDLRMRGADLLRHTRVLGPASREWVIRPGASGDFLEAILAAAYLDQGHEGLKTVMRHLVRPHDRPARASRHRTVNVLRDRGVAR